MQEPGNDALLAYAWQRRKRLHGRQAIHQHTSIRRTADQRRKESRFTELKEIERRGRGGGGQIHERMRDLPSLKQATKFSTDLLRFQKNV